MASARAPGRWSGAPASTPGAGWPPGESGCTAATKAWARAAARPFASLFPRVQRWVKFSHEQGYDSPFSERIPTYRLERCAPLADLTGRTHFFWRSGAQFYDYLQANPEIRGAWHGCGPGNTFSMIRAAIGEERVRAFLSADVFRQEVEQ